MLTAISDMVIAPRIAARMRHRAGSGARVVRFGSFSTGIDRLLLTLDRRRHADDPSGAGTRTRRAPAVDARLRRGVRRADRVHEPRRCGNRDSSRSRAPTDHDFM
jgi:hypothetical protein